MPKKFPDGVKTKKILLTVPENDYKLFLSAYGDVFQLFFLRCFNSALASREYVENTLFNPLPLKILKEVK